MQPQMKTTMLILTVFVLGIIVAFLLYVFSYDHPKTVDMPVATPPVAGGCVIGGCSKELCTDASEGPAVSPCVYVAQFACYKNAKCERQADGQCGWTETPALKMCIAGAR